MLGKRTILINNCIILGTAVINTHSPDQVIPKREEPGKTGRHPVLKYRVPHGSHVIGTGVINKHTLQDQKIKWLDTGIIDWWLEY